MSESFRLLFLNFQSFLNCSNFFKLASEMLDNFSGHFGAFLPVLYNYVRVYLTGVKATEGYLPIILFGVIGAYMPPSYFFLAGCFIGESFQEVLPD